MSHYATSYYDIEAVTLVKWNGQLYGVWDDSDEKTIRLVPCEALASFNGDEDVLEDVIINAPLRQIQLLESVKAEQSDVRAFFRLDVMPWELAVRDRFPFSSATARYAFTEDDLLTLIDRIKEYQNSFLLDIWRETFLYFRNNEPFLLFPDVDQPGLSFAYLSMRFFDLMDWFDPEEDDYNNIIQLRDCYLQSKGKPLAEMVIPDFFRADMLTELEKYVNNHPVTEEIRTYYANLLENLYEAGDPDDIRIYAYAYYGGNGIVPCDWKKAEQALLRLFDPNSEPPVGDKYAANSLGYIYYSDRLGTPDYKRAFRCFSYGAEHHVIESTYKLSDMYRFGHGTERNPEKAWAILSQLYKKTDKRHITKGKYADIALRMGYCYRDGIGVNPDHKQAYEYFMKAQKAIEARMKKAPEFGDSVVANNIRKAIESIKQH